MKKEKPTSKEQTYSKREVAKQLDTSTRTIERWSTNAGITPEYRKGAHGMEARYTQEQIERLKEEKERAGQLAPPTMARVNSQETTISLLERFTQAMEALNARLGERKQLAPGEKAPEIEAVRLSELLMLDLRQAAQLSGLSRSHLIKAIHSNALKAQKLGRGWKIKRADLDRYVKEL